MTDEALRRAIRVCVQNAHASGNLTRGSAPSLALAIAYAENVLGQIVEARIQQGIEEAWINARKAAEPAETAT